MTMTRFDDPADMTEGERFRELVSILAAACTRLKRGKIPTDIAHIDPSVRPPDSHVSPPGESALKLSKRLASSGEPSLHCPRRVNARPRVKGGCK